MNFELSSAAFSTCAFAGVEAREGSFELTAEVVAAGSAMVQSVSGARVQRAVCSVQCRTRRVVSVSVSVSVSV